MSAVASPSEGLPSTPALARLRGTGGISVAFASNDGATRLKDLEERDGWRAKFPSGGIGTEAIFINTCGGMLGGDHCRIHVSIGNNAAATVASQSAERIYRALDAPTEVGVSLDVADGACLHWLPQETILFNGARLSRRIDVTMATSASVLICEAVVFGRTASGEVVNSGAFRDAWRVTRGGILAYADNVALADDMGTRLKLAAIGNGARAAATVLYIAPDAEDRRDGARDALGTPSGRAAISAWNGMLAARFLAPDGATLRSDLIRVVSYLSRAPMPRVWNC